MDLLEIWFELERETKNTIRYKEEVVEGKPPVVGVLYVQKWALGENPPERLKMTLGAVS